MVIVSPATVVGRHRQSFRLWRRCMAGGSPRLDPDLLRLIRRLSGENPLWGAQRIQAELRLLGCEVAESTVAKYRVRPTRLPSPRRRRRCRGRSWRAAHAAAVTDPTFLPRQPRRLSGLGRFLRRAHGHVPAALWFPRVASRPETPGPLQMLQPRRVTLLSPTASAQVDQGLRLIGRLVISGALQSDFAARTYVCHHIHIASATNFVLQSWQFLIAKTGGLKNPPLTRSYRIRSRPRTPTPPFPVREAASRSGSRIGSWHRPSPLSSVQLRLEARLVRRKKSRKLAPDRYGPPQRQMPRYRLQRSTLRSFPRD